jgi:hypothetical protein
VLVPSRTRTCVTPVLAAAAQARPAAAGHLLGERPATPAARPGTTHRDERNVRRADQTTRIEYGWERHAWPPSVSCRSPCSARGWRPGAGPWPGMPGRGINVWW